MANEDAIPEIWRARIPLITPEGYALLERIINHPDAPLWNFEVGDRVTAEDLAAFQAFSEQVFSPRQPNLGRIDAPTPPASLLAWIAERREHCTLIRRHIPTGYDLERDWIHIPTMSREDIVLRLEQIVPFDADIERIIAYDTSGTTGHAIQVPHHPRALAQNHALIQCALAMNGVGLHFSPDQVACVNVSSQRNAYTFASLYSVWQQAGFAKLNLHPDQWPGGIESAKRYFAFLDPALITSNPVALAEMMRLNLPIRPHAILSTALTLSPELKARLEQHYACPVFDWYSTTETGPIAATMAGQEGLMLIAPDLFVETLDAHGHPVGPDTIGELTVTGGRNPFLPLLRYRTGDHGRLVDGRILDFQGRAHVSFRATDGSPVNSVDIGRILRLHTAFVQHEFVQHTDDSCTLRIRPAPGAPLDIAKLDYVLRTLFGPDQALSIQIDETLGHNSPAGKVLPYRREV